MTILPDYYLNNIPIVYYRTAKQLVIYLLALYIVTGCKTEEPAIDRHALVSRHNVVVSEFDSLNVLSVGNGEFAYSVDITGMQTFPEYHLDGIPLGTYSNWGWHNVPNRAGYHHDQVARSYEVGRREVRYYHDYRRETGSERSAASVWLRENPHRMHLGQIGLVIIREDGSEITPEDLQSPRQLLDLWNGKIQSRFEIEGVPVKVVTVCHPGMDLVSFRISSDLVVADRLRVKLKFPAADPGWRTGNLWGEDELHSSTIISQNQDGAMIKREQDSTIYFTTLSYSDGTAKQQGVHTFIFTPSSRDSVFELDCHFSRDIPENQVLINSDEIAAIASNSWRSFWESGGAVDFSGCTDKRAQEVERRVVLSQYLTNVNCSGSLPPQETGLTFNSWHGKFHLEMHWWHAVHFSLWQRGEILSKQMDYYETIREEARKLASYQGYSGCRWPKMVGPDGLTSPSTVGNYLVWQQPHYIFFAELLYNSADQKQEILNRYADLVFETAEFMADFALFDSSGNRFILPPPLIPAQETFPAGQTFNPAFETVYWHWGLKKAMEWKERIGSDIPGKWLEVYNHLPGLTISDSLYLFTENATDSYSNMRYISDHPMVLGCLGVLPETKMVDRNIMMNTFYKIHEIWNWPSTWGWDYPMAAMAAAELGKYESAVEMLLMDTQKNRYLLNGHNYQDERLPVYLPGNGGLLTAVANMCVKDQFPKDGNWDVKWENLSSY